MDKLITKLTSVNAEAKPVLRSMSRLVESASLLIVAYYNYANARHGHIGQFEYKIRIAASVVIGLRGAYEMLRYLAEKEAK